MGEAVNGRVGAFELLRPLARGGQGQVWMAVHSPTQHPAAVKLLVEEAAPGAERFFETEIAAFAALDHPNIVGVLDTGRTDAAVGVVAPGQPWLAMELVDGGTGHSLSLGGMAWPGQRELLRDLLLALAHAHARGLIHRDVKPANLLRLGGPYPSWKLADFGLAHMQGGGPMLAAATYSYAAPEQLKGGDQGPWTDLFAVGSVGWRLATGASPFRKGHPRVLPAFQPTWAVPEGLEAWLRWCLQDAPNARPAHAAAALEALERLASGADEATEPRQSERNWRRPERPPRPLPLHGAGLGLFRLRARPMVGREPERDALWAELEQLGDRPRTVVLRGEVGAGAQALLHWLGTTAEEQGLARRLALAGNDVVGRLAHAIGGGASHSSLGPLNLPPVVVEATVEASGRRLQRRDATLVTLLLDRLEGRWVVDLSGAPGWLVQAVVEWAEEGPPVSALVVLGCTDAALATDDQLDEAVAQVSGLNLELQHMSSTDVDELLSALLPLEPGTAAVLAAHGQGLPGRIIEELTSWVEQGRLELGSTGFRLRPGVPASVAGPQEALTAGLGAAELRSLRGLALLGPLASQPLWRSLGPISTEVVSRLLRRGVVRFDERLTWTSPEVADALVAAIPDDERRSLHGTIAEQLDLRHLPGAGRHYFNAGRWSESIAPMLVDAEAARLAGDGALVLLLADQALTALVHEPERQAERAEALRLRAWVLDDMGDRAGALDVLKEAMKTAERSGDPATCVRVLRARSSLLRRSGQLELALRCILGARIWAERAPEQAGAVFFEQGMVHRASGLLSEGVAVLHKALGMLSESSVLRGDVLLYLGVDHYDLEQYALAEQNITEAMRVYEAAGVRHGVAAAKDGLGSLAQRRGDLVAAEAYHREALALQGSRRDRAITRMNLGMVLCGTARWEEAVQMMRASLQVFEQVRDERMARFSHATLLWPLSRRRRWSAFDHHLAQLEGGVAPNSDVRIALEQALLALPGGLRRAQVEELLEAQSHPGSR